MLARFNLAQTMRKAGVTEGVEPLLLRVLEDAPVVLSEGNWRVAGFRAAYGQFLMGQGRLDEAQEVLLGSHADSLELLGSEHPLVGQQRAWIVELLEKQGRSEEARRWREGEAGVAPAE